MKTSKSKTELATFAMGCFWSPDLLFSKVPGVISAVVGYIDGNEKLFPQPTYEQVCSGKSRYAEAVQITFNPIIISYSNLLDLFWQNHNPTTKNQQGPDFGEQYRSAIFFHSSAQKNLALRSKTKYQKKFSREIVTEIKKAPTFFPAENYHQKYLEKRGQEGCHI